MITSSQIPIDPKKLPKVILFGGEKGGCGKSTLAENFSVALAIKGVDVILVDTDTPQPTCTNWADRRHARIERDNSLPIINCIQASGNVRPCLKDLSQRYQCVVVDAGGRDSQELRTALATSDLFIAPLEPSQNDMETVEKLYNLVKQTRDFNENLQCRLVLSKASTHPSKTEINDAIEFLDEYSDLMPLIRRPISQRKAFRDAAAKGLGVLEMQDYKASEELLAIIKEVIKHVVQETICEN